MPLLLTALFLVAGLTFPALRLVWASPAEAPFVTTFNVVEFPVTTYPNSQVYPAIGGNIVVWVDYRNKDVQENDIYGKNLATGQEFPITTNPADQAMPAISGNIVVWYDGRNMPPYDNGWDIYGAWIGEGWLPFLPTPTITPTPTDTPTPTPTETPTLTPTHTPTPTPTDTPTPTPTNTPTPIAAAVDIVPHTLNARSQSQWVTAYIELPPSYDPQDIALASVRIRGTIPAVTDPRYDFVTDPSVYLTDMNQNGVLERMVKFDRSAVQDGLNAGMVELTVTGTVNGTNFEGSDTIRVIRLIR